MRRLTDRGRSSQNELSKLRNPSFVRHPDHPVRTDDGDSPPESEVVLLTLDLVRGADEMSDPSREGCVVGTAWKRGEGGISFETRRRSRENDSPKHPTRFSRQACIRKGTLVAETMMVSAPAKRQMNRDQRQCQEEEKGRDGDETHLEPESEPSRECDGGSSREGIACRLGSSSRPSAE